MKKRSRRLKLNENIRNMVQDVYFSIQNLVQPIFVIEGKNIKDEIKSMPGQFKFSLDNIDFEIEQLYKFGIKNILLFGIPDKKDDTGSEAYNPNGIVQKAVRKIKKLFPDIILMTDVCMCEYTAHGHCGVLNNNYIDNDKTLEYLAKISISHADAGSDIIAPSDMMDGRIGYIRESLDNNGFINKLIMSYSVKYSSSYYGPFRDAADSAPSFGDRKNYQMDFKRKKEAIMKAYTDIEEGADIIMVKPALAYLDIVKTIKDKINAPLAVYNVSGEYAMIKAAGKNGFISEEKIVMENMYSFKRAGADIIISYHSKDIAKWILP